MPASDADRVPSTLADVIGEVWCALLEVDHPSGDQNFFALGGDSLKALELLSEIEARTGWEPDLGTLFADGTFDALLDAAVAHSREQ